MMGLATISASYGTPHLYHIMAAVRFFNRFASYHPS